MDPSGLIPQDPLFVEYIRARDRYNRDLFEYYQRLLQVLLLVGEELYANGVAGLDRFPWLQAFNCNCTAERGINGLCVPAIPGGLQGANFPVNWPRLANAMRYSQQNYGSFDDWWLVDGSSFNVHGLGVPSPWLFLSTEAFYGSETAALAEIIHEPLHDLAQYGPDWFQHANINEIMGDWQTYVYFLTRTTCNGKSLWDRILEWAGPRPTRPDILR
jgi:hypothetical protein